MKILFFIAAISLVAVSCNNNKASNSNINSISHTTDSVKIDSFFPVTSFIKGQMRMLDSMPVTPLHTITINNKIDSLWIKQSELKSFLSPFLSPEIRETNLVNFFKETSFNDQTLNAITFTYDPLKVLPDSISLIHWDVYIDPETGKVTKVYLVKNQSEKLGTLTLQLTWKTDKYAKIVTLLNQPGGITKLIKEEKFIWNFN